MSEKDRLGEMAERLLDRYLCPCPHSGSTTLGDPDENVGGVPCSLCGLERIRSAFEALLREAAMSLGWQSSHPCQGGDWLLRYFGLEEKP